MTTFTREGFTKTVMLSREYQKVSIFMLNPTILGLTKFKKRNRVLAVLFIKESIILFDTFFDQFLLVFHDNSVYFYDNGHYIVVCLCI